MVGRGVEDFVSVADLVGVWFLALPATIILFFLYNFLEEVFLKRRQWKQFPWSKYYSNLIRTFREILH